MVSPTNRESRARSPVLAAAHTTEEDDMKPANRTIPYGRARLAVAREVPASAVRATAMQVNDVARLSGVPAHVVRYYSRIGLLSPGRNPHNGYKTFAPADVACLRFIRLARRLGYSLTDIAQILSQVGQGRLPASNMRAMLERRLTENREQIESLVRMQTCMEQALARWREMPEHITDLAALCRFIEPLAESGVKA
jgi:DNA-binding transcriptional MerR regulator